ncbi:MAG: hypothetical protein NTU63_03705 [Candidatus Pacearchaeota archaeon]|nr:hypothetical protein [Candidatus Pacearchaeota archaeon]
MNKLLKLLGIGAIALASLCGCKEYKFESITKHEDAIVRLKRIVRYFPEMNRRHMYNFPDGTIYMERMGDDYILSYRNLGIQMDQKRLSEVIEENNLGKFISPERDKRPTPPKDNRNKRPTGGLSPRRIQAPPLIPNDKYYVFFDGNVDFEVDDRRLFSIFRVGDKADVTYREVYLLTYDDLNDDGEKELIKKSFLGNSFRDAQPKPNN